MYDKKIKEFILRKALESASEFKDSFSDSMIDILKEDIKQQVDNMSEEEKTKLMQSIKEQEWQ